MEPSVLASSALFTLSNRTIFITGGLGAMATALAAALLDAGADVISSDLHPENQVVGGQHEEWSALERKASQLGRKLLYKTLDIRSDSTISELFEVYLPQNIRYPLRGLVCCAGTFGRRPATSWTSEQTRRILDVNVIGTLQVCSAAAMQMQKHGQGGSIVIVASMSGYVVNRGVDTVAYNASKAALHQMTRSLACEWGGRNEKERNMGSVGIETVNQEVPGRKVPIRVNSLSPGYIRTEATGPTLQELPHLETLWPDGNVLGRLSYAHEFRAPIIYLLADGSSFMTGADLRVDGGHCAW